MKAGPIKHDIGVGDFTWAFWVRSYRLPAPFRFQPLLSRHPIGIYLRPRRKMDLELAERERVLPVQHANQTRRLESSRCCSPGWDPVLLHKRYPVKKDV